MKMPYFACLIYLLFNTVTYAQSLDWAFGIGGTDIEEGRSITTDINGNVYVTGTFRSSGIDFDPGPGVSLVNLNAPQGYSYQGFFIAKYDPSGNFLWVNDFSNANTYTNISASVVTDDQNNVYIAGSFSDTIDFDPGPGITNLTALYDDAFVAKYASNGDLIWAKSFTGTGNDNCFATDIEIDASGNVYTIGAFEETVDFDPGAGTNYITPVGGLDIFLSKLNNNGDLIWVKTMGGIQDGIPQGLSLDANGNAVLAGYFKNSVDFDPGPAVFNLSSTGTIGHDIFVAKYDVNGNFIWAKSAGSTNNDEGRDVVVDSIGSVYVTGYFFGTVDFDPGVGVNNMSAAGSATDPFVLKLDENGDFEWSVHYGNSLTDMAETIDLDTAANIYVAGSFQISVDFDPGPGVHTLTSQGNRDYYLLKLDSTGAFVWAQGWGSAAYDTPADLHVTEYDRIHLTGLVESTVDFDFGPGVNNVTSNGIIDCFVMTINQCSITYGTDVQIACDSLTWIDGNTYTSDNNSATWSLTTFQGCDSIVTLNLTIKSSSTITDTQVACESFTWMDGLTYTSSNNSATWILTNAQGCDSTIILDLTINNSSTSTDTQVACDSFTWIDGITYTSDNNSATWNLTNAVGCDSLVTLDLTINTVDDGITQTNDLSLQANASGSGYQWIDCMTGNIISGETNQAFTATYNSQFAVIVTENNCSDTSDCVVIDKVSIDEYLTESALIYPNPADDFIRIELMQEQTEVKVLIYNSISQLMGEQMFNGDDLILSTRNYPQGIYTLVIESEEQRTTQRFAIYR